MRVLDKILDFPKGVWGEDRYFIGRDTVGVIDGSSPISGVPVNSYYSQAEWLAESLAESLPICLGLDLPQACKLVTDNLKVAQGYSLESSLSPCCTFAGLQVSDDTLTGYVLGDCTIVLEFIDGKVETLSDNRIRQYSNLTRDCVLEARKQGLDEVGVVAAQMTKNRAQMNVDGGFWTVALEGSYETEFLVRTYDVRHLKRCLLFSDGFERLFIHDIVKVKDILTQRVTLDSALKKLREYESKGLVSEVKPHDDAVALLVSFL